MTRKQSLILDQIMQILNNSGYQSELVLNQIRHLCIQLANANDEYSHELE
jgi:hypothetical protein